MNILIGRYINNLICIQILHDFQFDLMDKIPVVFCFSAIFLTIYESECIINRGLKNQILQKISVHFLSFQTQHEDKNK